MGCSRWAAARSIPNPGPFSPAKWLGARCSPPAARRTGVEVFLGPGRHLVRYPLRGGALTNIVAVEERDQWAAEDWAQVDDPKHLRAAFTDFSAEIREMLAGVAAPNLWGLFRHPVARVWHGGALVLLGDAAHPTLPFLAQGANLALEDAWSLIQALETAEMPQALEIYVRARKPRAARVIEAANDNARNYHLRPGPTRFAAHSALRLASALRPPGRGGPLCLDPPVRRDPHAPGLTVSRRPARWHPARARSPRAHPCAPSPPRGPLLHLAKKTPGEAVGRGQRPLPTHPSAPHWITQRPVPAQFLVARPRCASVGRPPGGLLEAGSCLAYRPAGYLRRGLSPPTALRAT